VKISFRIAAVIACFSHFSVGISCSYLAFRSEMKRVATTACGFNSVAGCLHALGTNGTRGTSLKRHPRSAPSRCPRLPFALLLDTTKDVGQAISQMTNRGGHGVELRQRAAYLTERAGMNPTPRNIDREGMGLIDWPQMNKAVGDALDKLTKRCKKP
jgi:hypothetical protein